MNWKRAWKRRLRKLQGYSTFRKSRFYTGRLTRAKILSYGAMVVFVGVVSMFLLMVILFAWYAKDLPQPDKIKRKEGFSTKIYDRNEKLLYDVFADQRRTPVKITQVPMHCRQATIAIEDKDFYRHKGFDPRGWLRATINIVFKRRLQGGSTLTQQLVKNVLLSPERTLPRKLKEFILAIQIESKYSKDEILQMYLNESPYGGTAWGIEAASEVYFGKKVSDLSLAECALLAGLPQRPSAYSPFGSHPEYAKARQEEVLRRMREDEYITRDQEKKAREEKLKFLSKGSGFKAPHFVMYVKSKLVERYGERMVEQGGLKVITALDLDLQEEAQEIVTEEVEKAAGAGVGNGAALVMDPETGEILAMVGSKDYDAPDYDGKVNVTLSLRQPGSAIKPVTYVTGFKKGYTPASLIMDVRTPFPGGVGRPDYVPVNYDGKHHGPLQIRYALGSSINVPAVKWLAVIKVKEMLKTAYEMGLTTLEPTDANVKRLGLSVTLGGGEVRLIDLVTAYSSFANTGLKVEPVSILKVSDNKGKVMEEKKFTKGKRILSEGLTFLINHILSDNEARLITFGQNSLINISGYQIPVKTGTTDDKRDNWTVGWNKKFIVGVWVGNNDNTPMSRVASGVTGAAPIWRRIVYEAIKQYGAEAYSAPGEIVMAEVDAISGYAAHDGFPSRSEYFIKGTEPKGDDPAHTKLKICRAEGKLATPSDIDRGDYEEKEYFVFKEEDPLGEAINKWQEAIDAWTASQEDSRYHPPTEYCGTVSEMVVKIREPEDKAQVGNDVTVKAEVRSVADVDYVAFYVDGSEVLRVDGRPYETQLDLADGRHTISVKAGDVDGNEGNASVSVGVNVPWESPTPTPSPEPTSTPEPSPTESPEPSPSG